MASFSTAYKTVRANEGGYRNVSWDKGGETYKGVARNFHPNWAGWKIVDEYKKSHTLKSGDYIPNTALDKLVQDYFEANFWKVNNLDKINNQTLATLCFDIVIQHGLGERKIINDAINRHLQSVPLSDTVTLQSVAVMNAKPEAAYKAIAEDRIEYVNSLKDSLGPDFNAVLSRAKAFLTRYSGEVAAVSAGLILVGALFFF